jgi:formylmethanofuran dehydrogenase subunit E-like metal-binding protein
MNEKEIEMIKFGLELNDNCVGWDFFNNEKVYVKTHNDDYTVLTLTNGIEYKLPGKYKTQLEIHNCTMIYFFPDEQLIDDDVLIFCGSGEIYYGS